MKKQFQNSRNMTVKLATAALGMASAWMMINPANAATVNVTHNEASVGLNYTIGFGPYVTADTALATSDGLDPAIALLGGTIEGWYPNQGTPTERYNSISVNMTASASIAYDRLSPDTSIYGTSSASLAFGETQGVYAGFASAPSNQNYIFYEFAVLEGPVSYSVNYHSDAGGLLRLNLKDQYPIVNLAAGGSFLGTLNPGIYTLTTFLSIAGTDLLPDQSGTNSFAMTFKDTTLTVNPVPIPAAAWLFLSALGGLVIATRKQLKA